MSSTRVLTGITTTGAPHLGNYVGAIRPAIAASRDPEVDAYLFLADYHALIKNQNPDEVAQSSREIAATWLALGLDPENTYFYRQSDIPEITELSCPRRRTRSSCHQAGPSVSWLDYPSTYRSATPGTARA